MLGAGTERPRAVAAGFGGAGCNTIRALPQVPGLDLLAVNDLPHPSMAGVKRRLLLEKTGLRDLAAMDEHAVKDFVSNAEQALAVELADAEMVIPLAGLGGEMGSWGATLCARVAALKGATTLAVVTTPFSAEGPNRRGVAAEALEILRKQAHGVVALPNDPLLRVAPRLPILRAFEVLSKLVAQPVHDLLRVLTREDLPMLKSVLRGAGEWQLGIGESARHEPETAAVEAAFRSPWITHAAEAAKEVLVLIATPEPDERTRKSVLRNVDVRAPRAGVTWGSFAEPAGPVRVTALLGF